MVLINKRKMSQSTIESKNKKEVNRGKAPAKETILSPRFYTTDFEAMENMDLSNKWRGIRSDMWGIYERLQ